jgi:hypothetical protein
MHEDGFHGEDRRESERRDPPPPMHVSVDGISNGARRLLQEAIHEARKTRRWIVSALLGLGVVVFAAGEFRGTVENGLKNRPTEAAVQQLVDERDAAMVDRLHEQQIILEVMGERQRSTIQRLDVTDEEMKRIKERIGVP